MGRSGWMTAIDRGDLRRANRPRKQSPPLRNFEIARLGPTTGRIGVRRERTDRIPSRDRFINPQSRRFRPPRRGLPMAIGTSKWVVDPGRSTPLSRSPTLGPFGTELNFGGGPGCDPGKGRGRVGGPASAHLFRNSRRSNSLPTGRFTFAAMKAGQVEWKMPPFDPPYHGGPIALIPPRSAADGPGGGEHRLDPIGGRGGRGGGRLGRRESRGSAAD